MDTTRPPAVDSPCLTGVDNPTSLHCRSPRAPGKGPRRTECGSQSGRTKSTVSGGAAYSRAFLTPEVPPRRAHMLRGQGRSVCEHRGQAEALGQAPQRGNQWGSGTGRDESWQERAAVAPEPPRPQQRLVALRPRKSARQYQRKPWIWAMPRVAALESAADGGRPGSQGDAGIPGGVAAVPNTSLTWPGRGNGGTCCGRPDGALRWSGPASGSTSGRRAPASRASPFGT